eukprot:CAMPEP_0174728268 /NCGR_PEP_ID=MMETSP1094-20130205/51416_1 /TAXON_ID=156173 /ORGANISM="Chrysochromulina brevifilum, Strain UTEX LB 985" /LENGTH=84 /DNA_ID=CAMNT_0015930155 /DNA_START=245 /DNA_END=497 /DNA_ORIENTATION=-
MAHVYGEEAESHTCIAAQQVQEAVSNLAWSSPSERCKVACGAMRDMGALSIEAVEKINRIPEVNPSGSGPQPRAGERWMSWSLE